MADGDLKETEMPPALVRDLGELYGGHVFVPGEVDQRLLGEARAQLSRIKQRPSRLWWALPGAAAAAVIALTVLWQPRPAMQIAPPIPSAMAADIDRSGRVDILDAFMLARQLEQSTTGSLDVAWDINGDGKVDHRDVDAVAQHAVQLTGEARS